MARSDGDSDGDGTRSMKRFAVDRRSYLQLAGITAGAAALVSGPASASFSRRGITFKHTVDMVADAGCDPTGSEPCDEQIRDAADDFTLLKFPAGEYKITEKNFIYNKTNVGFLGVGDVRFSVPERFNQKVLVVDGGTGVLFEGIDIDQTAYGATPALHLGVEDDLRVHDVSLIGQGIHPDSIPKGQPGYSPGQGPEHGNPDVHDFFYPVVRSSDGTGLVTDLVANNHGLMGTYNAGNGRSGIWVGIENKGTMTFRDCHIEEFGSNGTYTSRTYGVVQYKGGVYRNNDNNQIRLGSAGSYIEDAILVVDTDSSEAPNPAEGLNYRGARIEMGHNYVATDVTIRNCDIGVLSTPHSSGAVVAQRTVSEFQIENTRIEVDADGVYGVLGLEPNGGGAYSPPPKPHIGTLRNVSITGDANGGAAVKVIDRPNSVVDGCCIQQNGSGRDGIVLVNSDGTRVIDTTIDVTDQRIREQNCDATVRNISTDGSCPLPNYGIDDSYPHTLTITTADERIAYTFSVSGDLVKSTANGATIDDNDIIRGSTVTGQGGQGGIDSYAFSGTLESFSLEGEANITLDGKPAHIGQLPDHLLSIVGDKGRFSYSFTVDHGLEKSTANGATVDDNDTISGNTAAGQGGNGGIDSYVFSGNLKSFDLDGEANVTLDGKPANVGQRPDHTLFIDGAGSRTNYTFTVSGSLEGRHLSSEDTISGSTATGAVGGGRDSYVFTGKLLSFDLDGEANVILNGKPAHIGQLPDHTLFIDGAGSRTNYTFTVSGNLDGQSLSSEDTISGSTATGAVGGGRDSYVFTGKLLSFDLDGEANVTLDGKPANVGQHPDHTLFIDGAGSRTNYTFTVSGNLEGRHLSSEDTISGSTATGAVGGGRDSYVFTGKLLSFDLDGEANVTLDGKPAHVGQRPDHILFIDGSGSRTNYSFSVSEAIAKSDRLTSEDSITGSSAAGAVGGGRDSYRFSGNLEQFSLDNQARIEVNRSQGTISIVGSGAKASYHLRVTGEFQRTSSLSGEDTISGGTASGAVGSGTDTYRYNGKIRELTLNDRVTVTVSRESSLT